MKDVEAGLSEIVDDLMRSGLTIEQQCNVTALLTFIATHFRPASQPLTSTERSRKWREKQACNGGRSRVPQKEKEKSPPAPPKEKKKNIYIHQTEFEAFWQAYPRKVGKGAARKAFATALTKTTIEVLTKAVSSLRTSPKGVEFTPHPATWLNQERWLDEGTSTGMNGAPYRTTNQFINTPLNDPPKPSAAERERQLAVWQAVKSAVKSA